MYQSMFIAWFVYQWWHTYVWCEHARWFQRPLHVLMSLVGCVIHRFAGAGLFDSHPTVNPELQVIDYTDEDLLWDADARSALMWQIALAAAEVEGVLGGPQDIEGGVGDDGQMYIMQSRPQM